MQRLILLLTTAIDAVVGNAHPTKKLYQLDNHLKSGKICSNYY